MNALLARITSTGLSGHLIAIVSGSLITFSLAPFYIWPLCVLAMCLFALSMSQALSFRQALIRGWCFGAGLFGGGASWVYVSIHEQGHASVPLATLITSGFCGGLAFTICIVTCFYARFFRAAPGRLLLALPAVWVLGEWVRIWLLTGFPWLFIGYSQMQGPLAGWAPIIGTLGISLILAATGSCMAYALLEGGKKALPAAAILAVLWLSGALLQSVEWVEKVPNGRLSVASVQANIPQEKKWERGFLKPTLDRYRKLTEQAWGSDIVLWPETAIPRLYHRAQGFLSIMDELATRESATLITGIPFRKEGTKRYYNSIVALGLSEGIYHKRRLVPFGEYVPLETYLRGLIEFFDLPMSSFVIGPEQEQLLQVSKGNSRYQIAPFICYEILYPDMVAEALPKADILLTISNDTWFGDSHGPVQHMQMAQMRALENGRYLIRGTNNGVTAIVDHKGQIVAQGERFVQTVVKGDVQVMRGQTPFSRFGTWPIVLLCALILASLTLIRIKNIA